MTWKKMHLVLLALVVILFNTVPKLSLACENVINSIENLKRIQIPINQQLNISGMDRHGIRIGFVNIGSYAGWDYAYIKDNDASNKFIFEKGSTNTTFKIREVSDNPSGFVYFNISKRGYIYLDKKENAREFTIHPQQSGSFKLIDVNTTQEVGIYRWDGYDYLTIGSGTKLILWITF